MSLVKSRQQPGKRGLRGAHRHCRNYIQELGCRKQTNNEMDDTTVDSDISAFNDGICCIRIVSFVSYDSSLTC